MKQLFLSLVAVALTTPSALYSAPVTWGHTAVVGDMDLAGGVINWAVLDSQDDPLRDLLADAFQPGDGSPGSLTEDEYLYLYQPLNESETGSAGISAHLNSFGPEQPSSWGWFADSGVALGFTDDGIAVAPVGEMLSPCSDLIDGCPSGVGGGDGPGGHLDSDGVLGLATDPDAILPSSVNLMSMSVEAGYSSLLSLGSPGGLIGFTSPFAPGIGSGALIAGGETASGGTPAPVPEPSALSLLAAGAAALWLVRRKR